MKDIITSNSPEKKRDFILNITMITRRLKDYNKELSLNLTRYKSEKDKNNSFLSSYKCLISPPKIMNQSQSPSSPTKGQQFKELFDQYKRINYALPDDYLKRNMFQRSPLLCRDRAEIFDYYNNESRAQGNLTTKNKVVKTLKRFDKMAFHIINNFEVKPQVEVKEERRTIEKGKMDAYFETYHTIQEKQSLEKPQDIAKEIKKTQREINKLNQLLLAHEEIKVIDSNNVTKNVLYLKGKLSPKSFGSNDNSKTKEGFIDKIKMNQSGISKFLSKQKEEHQSTMSTNFQPMGQTIKSKLLSKTIKLSQSQSQQLLLNPNQKNLIGSSPFPKKKSQQMNPIIPESTLIKYSKHNTAAFFKPLMEVSNQDLHEYTSISPIHNKRKQINYLYGKIKKENILNPHYNSLDIIDKLFSQFNESPKDEFNSNAIIHSMNKMKDNIQKTNIPYIIKKLQPQTLPEHTRCKILQISKLDKALSSSGRNIIKYFLTSKMGGG